AEACVWDLSPFADPPGEVVSRAEWLAGRRLDETGSVVPVAWAEAVDHLGLLIRDDPKNWHLVFRRGRAYDGRGKTKEAIADYSRAIEAGADHWDVYLYRGEARSRSRDWDAVVKDVSKAEEKGADEQLRLQERAWACANLRRHDEAILYFDHFVKRYPY